MKIKSIAVLVLGMMIGGGSAVLADPFSVPVATDLYNNNPVNGIPTPRSGTSGSHDLFQAANYITGKNVVNGFSSNAALDPNFIANDANWTMKNGFASFYLLGYSASNKNNLGYYLLVNGQPVKSNPLISGATGYGWAGDGSETLPLPGRDFSTSKGAVIGWYVDSFDWRSNFTTSTTYYSDPQFNSPSGYDHMVTYSLSGLAGKTLWIQPDYIGVPFQHTFTSNAYLIGFEDRLLGDHGTIINGTAYNTLGDDDYNDILILVDSTEIRPSSVPEPATITLVATGLAGLFLYRRRNRRS